MSKSKRLAGKSTPELEPHLRRALRRWGKLWKVEDLDRRITVAFSSRLTSSIGRCNLARGEIRLTSYLQAGSQRLLHMVLCHEAAHVATYLRHGPGRRPHGPEWSALVTAAGYTPARKLTTDDINPAPKRRGPSGLLRHLCPVCQHVRWARRPVRAWRCATCREAGLQGLLVIERCPPRGRTIGD